MPYRYKTQFYRIPVMGEGDMLTEEQEWIQMSTIDNLLCAAMFGCKSAFLEEGAYSLRWDKNHVECHLAISPSKEGGYSLLGIINSRMFKSMKDIEVGTLYGNGAYHVYVEYQNGLETDAECFSVRAYIDKQEESDHKMYLCHVDTHGEGLVNTNVDKIYAKNLLAHTMDATNPHGRVQTQDEMKIVTSLTVRGSNVNGIKYVTATTAGNGGSVVVQFDREPYFLTVYPEELGVGEIAWSISGMIATISNSGKSGIKLNIRADVK